jgi:hypothetical protein
VATFMGFPRKSYTFWTARGMPNLGESEGGQWEFDSATVEVNGVEVLHPSDLNQNVSGLERAVVLTPTTALRVRLASSPGVLPDAEPVRRRRGRDGAADRVDAAGGERVHRRRDAASRARVRGE